MKKIIVLLVIVFLCTNAFANSTFTQSFFDDHNYSTDNFSPKNNNYRDDAKIQEYGYSFGKDDSENYNCSYDAAGQVRCGDYKLRKDTTTNSGKKLSKKMLEHLEKLKKSKNVHEGDDFNCALDNGDEVYCWGSNKRGQLGTPDIKNKAKIPQKVDTNVKFKKVYTKAHYACALDDNNHAYCWGDGSNGEVGNGEKGLFNEPQKVKTDMQFSRLIMARTYTCGIVKQSNQVYCWGKGNKGTINLDSTVPVKI
ncbi:MULTISPECIES: RCC1 domain-containing protein [unclassified Francisella]|uniref:RCC1 domain-containing protein n=1 Tax=unclassified Francisella TaxID=2610885 RepID=UPI002E33C641|nr:MULTISPECIES: regulator [unclassified Francisella]MED7819168.1 regulator [Francisella sp. 19S2-4]MED7830359.1 regulator [Francisella sp. 19S2-10]